MRIVQKYGGSSVGTPEKIRNIASRIAHTFNEGHELVVVVSAMGDTTDELLSLAEQVSPRLAQGAHPRELDMLLTAGERISMALLSMALRDQNIEAISFTGSQAGIVTDEHHTKARILEIKPIRVLEELTRRKVVIIAGFQGVSRSKEITTLGRGGSDTTSVAMAQALKADRCEVYTDVPGIFSADPRKIPNARRYETLSLEIVYEMALKGAQVMHPRSIEIARQGGFPLYVGLSTGKSLKEEGTFLIPEEKISKGLELPSVVAVTAKPGLSLCKYALSEFLENQASGWAKQGVVYQDLILDHAQDTAQLLLEPSEVLKAGVSQALVTSGVSIVSLIGYHLGGRWEMASTVLELLKGMKIKPLGLTCHAQSITVWVRDVESESVVKKLHESLLL